MVFFDKTVKRTFQLSDTETAEAQFVLRAWTIAVERVLGFLDTGGAVKHVGIEYQDSSGIEKYLNKNDMKATQQLKKLEPDSAICTAYGIEQYHVFAYNVPLFLRKYPNILEATDDQFVVSYGLTDCYGIFHAFVARRTIRTYPDPTNETCEGSRGRFR